MIDIIKEKLRQYGAQNALEEENAVKEILQEIALYALWRAGFFDVALFQGGTSLRILHGLPRFSEDLDFLLRAPDPEFDWVPYLSALTEVVGQFGRGQQRRQVAEPLPVGQRQFGLGDIGRVAHDERGAQPGAQLQQARRDQQAVNVADKQAVGGLAFGGKAVGTVGSGADLLEQRGIDLRGGPGIGGGQQRLLCQQRVEVVMDWFLLDVQPAMKVQHLREPGAAAARDRTGGGAAG